MSVLVGRPHGESPLLIPAGHRHVRLHVRLFLPGIPAAELHHVIRFRQSLLEVAPTEGVVDDPGDVVFPALVDDRGARFQRLLGIEHGGQHLVLHLDQVEGPFGSVDIDGGDCGDPVADVPRLVGQYELILVLPLVCERRQTFRHHRTRETALGNVLVGDHSRHPRERLRLGGVDPDHPRVRMGAGEDPADEHPREGHVGSVHRSARRFGGDVRTGEALPNV